MWGQLGLMLLGKRGAGCSGVRSAALATTYVLEGKVGASSCFLFPDCSLFRKRVWVAGIYCDCH